MKRLDDYCIKLVLIGIVTAIALGGSRISTATIIPIPIADAGLPRYAALEPVVLDGTGSYDPYDSEPLSYAWRQISGPSVVITDSHTATPTISGFVQTDEIQECEFELIVSIDDYNSEPDTVKVVIVPTFVRGTKMVLENDSFDPNKPTFIWFDGAIEVDSLHKGGGPWNRPGNKNNKLWEDNANIISFDPYYTDPGSICGYHKGELMVFSRSADQIIVYLSAVAPNYCQPIQTAGLSLGGIPAIDVALRLNQTYTDARYAINHVSFLDATTATLDYPEYSKRVADFLANPVENEQCWLDSYDSAYGDLYPSALNVEFASRSHSRATQWYHGSLSLPESHDFNGGIVAGAYWSVIGPGKNLQLANTPDVQTYKFKWHGIASSGYMDFFNESYHPGRLPEPVTLIGPIDGAFIDANGALLSCEESENAVGYQLLFGPDPYCVTDYYVISDGPNPPNQVISSFPFDTTWWTIKVRDQYGSTIFAKPIRISSQDTTQVQKIFNITTGQRYSSIQEAIDEAMSGHEIEVSSSVYYYHGAINFKGKNITLRSTNPDDPSIVATTIIKGCENNSVVTFSSGEDANCVFAGFTISGGNAENGGGIYCGNNSMPTITNCVISNNLATQSGGGMYTDNSSPTVFNCIFSGNSANLGAGICTGSGDTTIINCTLVQNTAFWASGICNFDGSPVLRNCILWDNTDPEIGGIAVATYSNIRGGWPGEGNIDINPLFADTNNGDYHLKSQAGRWDPISQSWIQDELTSPCIDAGDPMSSIGLEPSPNGGRINIGAYGSTAEASKSL